MGKRLADLLRQQCRCSKRDCFTQFSQAIDRVEAARSEFKSLPREKKVLDPNKVFSVCGDERKE